jgi:hypothetical protein
MCQHPILVFLIISCLAFLFVEVGRGEGFTCHPDVVMMLVYCMGVWLLTFSESERYDR